jgi:hypothetical protein
MSDELKTILTGLKAYIYMSRPCLDNHGRSYLGNNMVALIEQAVDQRARDEAAEDEKVYDLAAEIDRVYDEERDRFHINLEEGEI